MNIQQTIISVAFTFMGSALSYFLSLKKTDIKIREVEINAETEILKIKEETKKEIEKIKAESNKEIEKIKIEHEEYRKTRKNESKLNSQEKQDEYITQIAYKFYEDVMSDPDNAAKKIAAIEKLGKKFPNKKNK